MGVCINDVPVSSSPCEVAFEYWENERYFSLSKCRGDIAQSSLFQVIPLSDKGLVRFLLTVNTQYLVAVDLLWRKPGIRDMRHVRSASAVLDPRASSPFCSRFGVSVLRSHLLPPFLPFAPGADSDGGEFISRPPSATRLWFLCLRRSQIRKRTAHFFPLSMIPGWRSNFFPHNYRFRTFRFESANGKIYAL